MAKHSNTVFHLSYHTTNLVFGNLRFLFFIVFLGVVYITNAHLAEGNVRKIQLLQKQIKEKKWEYTSIKSQIMLGSLQSNLTHGFDADDQTSSGGFKVIRMPIRP
jgi:hypothetical protein